MLKLARRQVSPQHMLFYGLGLWALVWITSPVEYYTHKEPAAVLLLVGYITAFFWGTLLLRKPVAPKDGVEEAWPRVPRNIKISFTILLLAGYLGLALRLFDLFFIKNYASFASAAAFRAGIGGADPATEDKGLISIVSAGLYPLAVVAFICAVFYKKHLYKWQFFFAALGLLPFMGYVVLIGARSPLFSAIIMCAVAWVASTGRQGISIRLSSPRFIKIAVVPLVIVVGFFFYSMSVFNQRIETFGFKRGDTIKVFEATRDARVKPAVRDEIFSTSPFSPALEAGTYLSFYYVHGVYYFQELYPHLQGRELAYGKQQFFMVFRLLSVTGLVSAEGEPDYVPYGGMFYTFFGNVLIDWGVAGGLIYCVIFGMICQYTWRKVVEGRSFFLMLYPFLASVIFHFPIVDMITGGGGVFYLIDICFAGLLFLLFSRMQFKSKRTAIAAGPSPKALGV